MVMGIPMWVIWAVLTVVFLIIEAITLGLTTIWCAAGCAVAAVLDLCGVSETVQLIAMVAVSVICFIICMIWVKPMLDAKHKRDLEPTNADRVLGKEGVVIKTIDPIEGKGQIKVMGQVWSAKADKVIEEGTKVKVISMEGVKVKVEDEE
ncbi:MAG: NfeD family protein [Clostridiales bacterium]|nr:NfeD family protein [Clostridiales bacterium]MBR6484031.1 NfeD family protein [Clostridiales bacterium]